MTSARKRRKAPKRKKQPKRESDDGVDSDRLRRFVEAMKRYTGNADWKISDEAWIGRWPLDHKLRLLSETREVLDNGPRDRLPPEPEVGATMGERIHFWIESIAVDAFEKYDEAHDWFVARDAMRELASEIIERVMFDAKLRFAGNSVTNSNNASRREHAAAHVIATAAVAWLAAELRLQFDANDLGQPAHVVGRLHAVAVENPASLFPGLRVDRRSVRIVGSTLARDSRQRWRIGALVVAVGARHERVPAGTLENAVREVLRPAPG